MLGLVVSSRHINEDLEALGPHNLSEVPGKGAGWGGEPVCFLIPRVGFFASD